METVRYVCTYESTVEVNKISPYSNSKYLYSNYCGAQVTSTPIIVKTTVV